MAIRVRPIALMSVFPGLLFLGGVYLANKVVGYYGLKEFMRRVRARNEVMKLQHAEVKAIEPPKLEFLSGGPMLLEELPGEYLFLFSGEFKAFLRARTAMGESPLFKDMHYLFAADRERVAKVHTEAMRTPLPNTTYAVQPGFGRDLPAGEALLFNKRRELIMRLQTGNPGAMDELGKLTHKKVALDKEKVFVQKFLN